MNILVETQKLKDKASKVAYTEGMTSDEQIELYEKKIEPLEKKAIKILMASVEIEDTAANFELVSEIMENENYHSPAEALTMSGTSLCNGCWIGSTPEENLDAYIEEVEMIKENCIDK